MSRSLIPGSNPDKANTHLIDFIRRPHGPVAQFVEGGQWRELAFDEWKPFCLWLGNGCFDRRYGLDVPMIGTYIMARKVDREDEEV